MMLVDTTALKCKLHHYYDNTNIYQLKQWNSNNSNNALCWYSIYTERSKRL